MKRYINFFLGIGLLCILVLIVWLNYAMKNNVGDIKFNSKIDDSSFKVCNEDRIFQYYSVGTSYKGERKAIREAIFEHIKDTELDLGDKSGFITFRFIVNCEGVPGRYRFKEVDEKFMQTTFKKDEVEKLKTAVRSLKNWEAGFSSDGLLVDSYYQINFKIIDGQIQDIF